MGRALAGRVTDGIQALVGRRNTVRMARFVLDRARLDVRNAIPVNGELQIQRRVLELTGHPGPAVVLDVGAHFGEWSGHLLRQAREQGARVIVHAFEPTGHSFRALVANVSSAPGREVKPHRVGMSSAARSATIYKPHEGAGSSSLYRFDAPSPSATEEIVLTTLDSYCDGNAIPRVDLVKCDAEGHDLHVLEGGRGLFRDHRIAVVQFEYNHRWIHARSFLRDAFALLAEAGYLLGKVTPRGVERYERWDPELETFRETNFVAVAPIAASWFPTIPWWK